MSVREADEIFEGLQTISFIAHTPTNLGNIISSALNDQDLLVLVHMLNRKMLEVQKRTHGHIANEELQKHYEEVVYE